MKYLLLLSVIFISTLTSSAQQRDTTHIRVDENENFIIDSAVVVKQRFITAKGFVKDDNGKPLPDVVISHGSGKKRRKTVSDKDGYFRLDSIRSGYPLVRFTKQGYMTLAYKFNDYNVEQVILAFDPNSTFAQYDLGYFKDSKLKSATAVRVISGDALRRYGFGGGNSTTLLKALLGIRGIGAVVLNNMIITPNRGETLESIIGSFNPNDIDLIAYLPPYSGNTVLYGFTSGYLGILVVRLKQK